MWQQSFEKVTSYYIKTKKATNSLPSDFKYTKIMALIHWDGKKQNCREF